MSTAKAPAAPSDRICEKSGRVRKMTLRYKMVGQLRFFVCEKKIGSCAQK